MKSILITILIVILNNVLFSQSEIKDTIQSSFIGCKYTIIRDKKPDTLYISINFPTEISVVISSEYDYKNLIFKPTEITYILFTTHDSKLITSPNVEFVVFFEDSAYSDTPSYETRFVIENEKIIEQYFIDKTKSDFFYFNSKRKYCKNFVLSETRKLVLFPKEK
jgi:hypothetical protein